MNITEPQMRTLKVLAELVDEPVGPAQRRRGPVHPRMVAKALWPDSPGWEKRSRRGSTRSGGALGATMPMKAGGLLNRLFAHGLVWEEDGAWTISSKGRALLDAQQVTALGDPAPTDILDMLPKE